MVYVPWKAKFIFFVPQTRSWACRMALIRSNENMNIQFSTFEKMSRIIIIIVISGSGSAAGSAAGSLVLSFPEIYILNLVHE